MLLIGIVVAVAVAGTAFFLLKATPSDEGGADSDPVSHGWKVGDTVVYEMDSNQPDTLKHRVRYVITADAGDEWTVTTFSTLTNETHVENVLKTEFYGYKTPEGENKGKKTVGTTWGDKNLDYSVNVQGASEDRYHFDAGFRLLYLNEFASGEIRMTVTLVEASFLG